MYMLLQDARENARSVQASRDGFEKTVKEQQAQVKQAQSARDAAERALAEAKKGTPQ
jgi:hypothetical protein